MQFRRSCGRSVWIGLGMALTAAGLALDVAAASASLGSARAGVPAAALRQPERTARPHPRLRLVPVQARGQPVLNVSKIILAEPAVETPLPIQVGPADAIAHNSFIRIRGLPSAAALTEGHSIAPGSWAIPIISLPNLRIMVPVGQSGKSEVTVALVTVDGTVMAEVKTALVVAAASLIAPGDAQPKSKNVASLGPSSSPPISDRAKDVLSTGVPSEAPPASEEQKRAAHLFAKGNEQLSQGNVASARLFFERAAEDGSAPAALALAGTYDAAELDRLGVRGVQPDPKLARKWYERARQLGAREAEERLKRLGAR